MQSLTASYFWISHNKVECLQLPPDQIMMVMGLPVWWATKAMVKNSLIWLRWGIRKMSGHVWGLTNWAINIGEPIWCNYEFMPGLIPYIWGLIRNISCGHGRGIHEWALHEEKVSKGGMIMWGLMSNKWKGLIKGHMRSKLHLTRKCMFWGVNSNESSLR